MMNIINWLNRLKWWIVPRNGTWRKWSKRSDQPSGAINQAERSTTAFTLIELLVVISIIGILAVLLIANFVGTRERARDAQRKSDLRELKSSLMMYYNSCNRYPQSNGGQIIGCNGTSCDNVTACSWGVSRFAIGSTVFMKQLPKDPWDSQAYSYQYINDNEFRLVSFLENKSDQAGPASQTQCGWNDGNNATNEYVVCED